MSPEESLRANLEQVFELPEVVIEWLLLAWDSIQSFDDFADGDHVDRTRLDHLIWNSLVGMNSNAFFSQNSQVLTPLIAAMILKWQASDIAERNGNASAKSYMWRAGYYDLVLISIQLVHGASKAVELSPLVMDLYGETFEQYSKEFNCA